ncbi:MAG: rhomboid family intramembrane serine protease [Acetatifactor sp.]|nr:rhomboid family intramembrane serine protease [Lachnospiraceae bacterium]MDE5748934.1 rhomboid family intramembrane serine protease [Acetatifactor sp.]
MKNRERKFKVSFNSPAILTFTIICAITLLLNWITKGYTNNHFFSVYRSSLISPLTYVRLFGHIVGHADLNHFVGNIMLILVVGPMLEEKYGSSNIVFVILATALATGIAHLIFVPGYSLLGASGVVFAFIMLSSFTCIKEKEIPLTFILVAALYIGEQVYQGLFVQSNISNLSHILGGFMGSGLGYVMHKNKMNRY